MLFLTSKDAQFCWNPLLNIYLGLHSCPSVFLSIKHLLVCEFVTDCNFLTWLNGANWQNTGSTISLCDFWFGLKWHSNVSYIWKQDVFITTKTHHLIWNISWCQLILFLSSKLTWSKQAIFHYFSNDFYLKLSFFWN